MSLNTKQNKKVIFEELGGVDKLKVISTDENKKPGKGELGIRVKALALNRADLLFISGLYGKLDLPTGLGFEASGVVEQIGEEVDGFKVGDSVSVGPNISIAKYPLSGEYVLVPENSLIKNPDNVSHNDMAANWVAYFTSYYGLQEAKLTKGDTVLINAASSSVSIAAIHLAKYWGARVIAVGRSNKKRSLALEHGADHYISTQDEDLVAKVKEYTDGKGVQVIYDSVGGPQFSLFGEIASIGAKIVVYGALDQAPTPIPMYQLIFKSIQILGFTLGRYLTADHDEKRLQVTQELNQLFSSKKYKSLVGKVYKGIDSYIPAVEFLEKADLEGKIIIDLSQ
ncbi:hypothetical protein CYY_010534 [Polysphondylium violaceum]|uniref:Enoyl reductase (ER) domain-containing protein n=1 Tax=Polysphondylium violaceum TaxID=133409 RepID=A0A8J4PJQ1_9MYCE|nr:hypothetical protein CYY_010534 [Polysphondylium violaceum]